MRTISAILLTLLLVGSTVVGQGDAPPPPPPIDKVQVVVSDDGPANSAKVKSEATGVTTQNTTVLNHKLYRWSSAKNPQGEWMETKVVTLIIHNPKAFNDTALGVGDYSGQLFSSMGELVRGGKTIAGPNYSNLIGAP